MSPSFFTHALLYLFNDQVAELLQEDHHSLRSAVVLGAAPDETERVEERRQQSVYLWEPSLLYAADQSPQRAQIQIYVLRFQHRYDNHIHK